MISPRSSIQSSSLLSSTATVAVVTCGVLGVKLYASYKKWHSLSEQAKRQAYRDQVASNPTLVGPRPKMIKMTNKNDMKDKEKETATTFDLLTRYYPHPNKKAASKHPTVVMVHGFGCTSLEFGPLIQQLQLAHPINILVYDQVLFLNKSNHLLQTSRTAPVLAEELHDLLEQHSAGLSPPFLLVGHSYGGLIVQQYANSYPNNVKGLVLIDPAHERQFQLFPKDFTFLFLKVTPILLKLYQRLTWTGLMQWLDRCNLFNFPPMMLWAKDDPLRQTVVQLYSCGDVWKLVEAELQGCVATFNAMNLAASSTDDHSDKDAFRQCLNDLPMALVVANHRRDSPTLFPEKVTRAFLDLYQPYASQVFLADQSDHWVHMSQPDVVVQAVQFILQEVQQQ